MKPLVPSPVPGKRGLDLMLALAGVVLAAPFGLVIALAVRWADGGPALFVQERVGRRGRLFCMLKFRTMRQGATGRAITVGDDPRVTRVGRWLRRSKLDELPQLLNVLAGAMSLVGPRPEMPRYVACYGPRERAVLARRPGLTDPASLAYRDESQLLGLARDPERLYVKRVMPDKLRRSLRFAGRETLGADCRVLLRTLAGRSW